jgi:hypothetical protein
MAIHQITGKPGDGMKLDAIRWDVSWQGIYCLTLVAPSHDQAQLMAMHALGLDSLWAVEVSENTESQPGQPAQIKPL